MLPPTSRLHRRTARTVTATSTSFTSKLPPTTTVNRHEVHIDFAPNTTAHRTWTFSEHIDSVTVSPPPCTTNTASSPPTPRPTSCPPRTGESCSSSPSPTPDPQASAGRAAPIRWQHAPLTAGTTLQHPPHGPSTVRTMTAERSRRRRMRRRHRPPRGVRRTTRWEWIGLGALTAVALGLTVAALVLR